MAASQEFRLPGTFALLCAVGALVALADGLTRLPSEADLSPGEGPLMYQPYRAAYVFAFVTLPLCLVCARRMKTSASEGMLLWFVFCTVAYAKDFAYLHVPGVPIFITDVVLAALLVRLFVWPRLRLPRLRAGVVAPLALFWVAGSVAAVRGARSGQELLLVARDSSIVVYSLFILIGAYLIRNWDDVIRFSLFFAAGAGISILMGLAWLVNAPGQRRYIAFGVYVLMVLVGTLVLTIHRRLPRRWSWGLVALFGFGLLLANARSLFLAFLVLFVIVLLLGARGQMRRWKLLTGVPVVTGLAVLVVMQTDAGAGLAQRTFEDLISGTLRYADDPNVQFRLLAWVEALERFSGNPFAGEGYGVPFVFERSDLDVRPHSTYLGVLYKMGLLGLLPLLALIARVQWSGLRSAHDARSQANSSILYALLLGQLAMCLFGIFNLMLESPFLAAIFWTTVGIAVRVISLLRRPNSELHAGAAPSSVVENQGEVR